MSLADFLQGLLALSTGMAITLMAKKDHMEKWGWLIGLLSQPLWFYVTWTSGQWGMVLAAVLYSIGFIEGTHKSWVAHWQQRAELARRAQILADDRLLLDYHRGQHK